MNFKEQHESYKRPISQCGIYKITNNTNQKSYVGKSIDIKRRFSEHKSAYEQKRNARKPLYLAFQKYGQENFSFEIIELCNKEELNEKERYWIQKLDTSNSLKGYNITPGGDGYGENENHPNHKLNETDIINIRTAYANRERKCEVEQIYKDRIGPSGFKKIWQGVTWSNIMPEVYTQENKDFHKNNTSRKGSSNGRSLLTEENVYDIRLRKKNGEHWESVYQDYISTGIKKSSFQNTWLGYNWKNIVVE